MTQHFLLEITQRERRWQTDRCLSLPGEFLHRQWERERDCSQHVSPWQVSSYGERGDGRMRGEERCSGRRMERRHENCDQCIDVVSLHLFYLHVCAWSSSPCLPSFTFSFLSSFLFVLLPFPPSPLPHPAFVSSSDLFLFCFSIFPTPLFYFISPSSPPVLSLLPLSDL